ncbi:MAG TPA: hypothetical protein PKM88_04610 [bacterium]|nr:hypothetical protein [bacterium]
MADTQTEKQWFWYDGTAVQGPCTAKELRRQPGVTATTQVCPAGEEAWVALGDCAELRPPAVPPAVPPVAPPPKRKPVAVPTVANGTITAKPAVAGSTVAAPARMNAGVAGGMTQKTWLVVLLVVLAGGGIWWYWSQRAATGAAVAAAPATDEDEDEDSGEADAAAQLREADNELTNDNLRKAEDICRAVLETWPELAAAHCQLGKVLEKQGRLAEALAAYRNAFARDDKNQEARTAMARVKKLLADEETAPEAEPATDEAETPRTTTSRANTAERRQAQQLLREAQTSTSSALIKKLNKLRTTSTDQKVLEYVNLGLGRIYLVQGKYSKAESALADAVAAGADVATAMQYYSSALETRRAAIPAVKYTRGMSMEQYQTQQDRYTESERKLTKEIYTAKLKCLNKLCPSDRRDLAYYTLLVDCYSGLEEYRKAAQACKRAAALASSESARKRWQRMAEQYEQHAAR